MFLLTANVSASSLKQRFAHAHSKILVLPLKVERYELLLVDPVRGFALQLFSDTAKCLIDAERGEAMGMLTISANVVNKDAFLARVVEDVPENLISNIVGKIWFPVLCRPDKMYPDLNMRHRKSFG